MTDECNNGHNMVFPDNNAEDITWSDLSLEKRPDGIENFR